MPGSRDPLLEIWDPLISRERLKPKLQIWHGDGRQWVLTKKMQN